MKSKDLEKIEKLLQDLEHNQKVSDQKNTDSFKDLRFRILSEATKTRQELEAATRAEIQVANSELEGRLSGKFARIENTLSEVEKRLNKRITDVGDLITIYFGKKTKVLDKRVAHLEQMQQAA